MRDRARRYARRVQVRFWPALEPDRSYAGYSRNISATGMFIATIHPMKPGTRLLIEMQGDDVPFEIEAIVMHSAKVSALLQSVRPSGMGVRFRGRSAGLEKLLPDDEPMQLDDDDRMVYPLYFTTVEELLEVFERDIKNGGLFVPTVRPAAMDQEVTVELNFPREANAVLAFVAKVVHRIASGPETGMGIAFSDPQDVVRRLGAIVEEMRAG